MTKTKHLQIQWNDLEETCHLHEVLSWDTWLKEIYYTVMYCILKMEVSRIVYVRGTQALLQNNYLDKHVITHVSDILVISIFTITSMIQLYISDIRLCIDHIYHVYMYEWYNVSKTSTLSWSTKAWADLLQKFCSKEFAYLRVLPQNGVSCLNERINSLCHTLHKPQCSLTIKLPFLSCRRKD